MKKHIKAALCAALLAVGGGNFYTALSGQGEEAELDLSTLEALGQIEGYLHADGTITYFQWSPVKEDIDRDKPTGEIKSIVRSRSCGIDSKTSKCYLGDYCWEYFWTPKLGEFSSETGHKCPSDAG